MLSSDAMPRRSSKRRVRPLFTAAVLILSAVALIYSIAFLRSYVVKERPSVPKATVFVAELAKTKGTVLVKNPGKPEWREIKTGTKLSEGDLVRTENSGKAEIRYRNGSTISIFEETVFTVRSTGDNRMEISVAPEASKAVPVLVAEENSAEASRSDSKPFVELSQIIPYGRSLELIGRIEPGNRLTINDEKVEVTGDGSFKHFTNSFPGSDNLAQLKMKVTNLAGRTWYWTSTYNFRPLDGDD